MTQLYCLASMAAWLSFTGISHHSLLPNIPLIHLSSVNSSPCPGITPQYLNSSSQPLRFPGELCPYLGCVCLQQELSDFSFHLGCHSSALSLSALNFSPLTQTIALMWGLDSCFSSPPTKGRSCPTNTAVFPPSSFVLPSFAWFYIFFLAGQVLLSTLSWCSAHTSVSEGVFLMYLWRQMYSTSTYSSAILFFQEP